MLGNDPDEFPVTYITLPRGRRPRDWDQKYNDPVVVLDLNLYGHPLAGLVWELHCEKIVKDMGFQRVPSWECLFYHRAKQLFLNIYVDDFKMAGRKANLAPMWKMLGEKVELEPPEPFHGSTYLGAI